MARDFMADGEELAFFDHSSQKFPPIKPEKSDKTRKNPVVIGKADARL
jgi:hypothetical protein